MHEYCSSLLGLAYTTPSHKATTRIVLSWPEDRGGGPVICYMASGITVAVRDALSVMGFWANSSWWTSWCLQAKPKRRISRWLWQDEIVNGHFIFGWQGWLRAQMLTVMCAIFVHLRIIAIVVHVQQLYMWASYQTVLADAVICSYVKALKKACSSSCPTYSEQRLAQTTASGIAA